MMHSRVVPLGTLRLCEGARNIELARWTEPQRFRLLYAVGERTNEMSQTSGKSKFVQVATAVGHSILRGAVAGAVKAAVQEWLKDRPWFLG